MKTKIIVPPITFEKISVPSKWKNRLLVDSQTEVSGSIEQEIEIMKHTLQELQKLNSMISRMNSDIRLFLDNRKTYQNKEM
tara:strand:- start:171 stop:413 length:243 start_codon:yes stop_codon:yes gene_type:complete